MYHILGGSLAVIVISLSGVITNCFAADEDLYDSFGGIDYTELATGRPKSLSEAPAAAFVITEDDIKAIGATRLGEMLELVPGFHDLFRFQGDHFVIRGVRSKSNFNPDVAVLVDGIPQNDVHLASQRRYIADVPLDIIKRIEIIRGPVSALYGEDAFAGVINIITKTAEDVKNSRLSIRSGSFNTNEGRWLQKTNLAGMGMLIAGQIRSTSGPEPFFQQDTQTYYDQLFSTNVSHAPGNANTDFEDYNFSAKLSAKDLNVHLRAKQYRIDSGGGFIGALDPNGYSKSRQYSLAVFYTLQNNDTWKSTANISYLDFDLKTYNMTFLPPGAFGGTFPDGIIDNPAFAERHYRFSFSSYYKALSRHTPRFGFGSERALVYDVSETRNYLVDPATGLPAAPLPSVQPVAADQLYSSNNARNQWYLFAQDEWRFAPDWTLTAGAHYDRYSDFGSTTNPRIALVWSTTQSLSIKLLHGSAFRAPTFAELYTKNNPASLGNPDLNPTTIKSTELVFDYRPAAPWLIDLSLFKHHIDDVIEYVALTGGQKVAQNASQQDGSGFELNGLWKVNNKFTFSGYYAYQKNIQTDNNNDYSYSPRNKILARVDWKLNHTWRLNSVATWNGNRVREQGDPRQPAPNYTAVDFSLLYTPKSAFFGGININNAFNQNAVAANDNSILGDIPLPGRSLYITIGVTY